MIDERHSARNMCYLRQRRAVRRIAQRRLTCQYQYGKEVPLCQVARYLFTPADFSGSTQASVPLNLFDRAKYRVIGEA